MRGGEIDEDIDGRGKDRWREIGRESEREIFGDRMRKSVRERAILWN